MGNHDASGSGYDGEFDLFIKSMQSEFPSFPSGCCQTTSQRVERQFGYKQVFGLFVDDDGIGHNHHWNESATRIKDLTAYQFGEFPRVYILKKNSPEAQKRYIPGACFMI